MDRESERRQEIRSLHNACPSWQGDERDSWRIYPPSNFIEKDSPKNRRGGLPKIEGQRILIRV